MPIDREELERIGAMESQQRDAELQAQMGNPNFQVLRIEPTTICIKCAYKLFAWDDHCPKCGLEFTNLMVIAHRLLEGCKIAVSWFEAAPINELEAVEAALEWNAPITNLAAAIKETKGGETDV